MRRLVYIGGPVAVILVMAAILGISKSQERDPFGPLRGSISAERTRYIPGHAGNGGPMLETSAIIEGRAAPERINEYRAWLKSDVGWNLNSPGTLPMYATHGSHLLPDAWLFMHQTSPGQYSLEYDRYLNPIESLVDGRIYKNEDYNELPLAKAPSAGS
jgi:hypothetical protein